uniref:Silicon transporter beta n=1 Tax=Savillea parva TaxID=1909275 RepID=A0A1D8RAE4_9EUKA|nr:silicon transporter beta [Savillea parva]|eukprot:m.117785 g.117785  ORF g.117785 m.117785 type:complete len:617 (-) comp10954_c0_seq4:39-1889(-)
MPGLIQTPDVGYIAVDQHSPKAHSQTSYIDMIQTDAKGDEGQCDDAGPADLDAPHTMDFVEHPLVVMYRQFSYVWSTGLLIFCFAIILYGIGAEWNHPPWDQGSVHPAFEVILFLILLFWSAILEGAQVSVVGLQSIPMESFRYTHPRAYKCCALAHKGPNVERFIVGRQFLLLFIVFMISRIGGAGDMPHKNFYIGDWEWSSEATQIFWTNSVLLIVLVIVPGNLIAQLMASSNMLAFLDLPYGAYYTVVLPSLAIESLGITHTSYILKDLFVYLSGTDTLEEEDPARRMKKDAAYYIKAVVSACLVVFSAVFVFKGLFAGQTGATNGVGWDKLPGWAAFLLTLFFLCVIGCCEGFQIAAVSLAKMPASAYKTKAPLAYRTTQVLYKGRNMQAFLVGRQVFVAMMMVLLAKVTTYAGSDGELVRGDDWGMGQGFNKLLQTGILGAIFVVNVGQLSFRMMASSFPVVFISNPVVYALLRIALMVEATGVVNSCWPLAWGLEALLGLRDDPVVLDNNGGGATNGKGSHDETVCVVPGFSAMSTTAGPSVLCINDSGKDYDDGTGGGGGGGSAENGDGNGSVVITTNPLSGGVDLRVVVHDAENGDTGGDTDRRVSHI